MKAVKLLSVIKTSTFQLLYFITHFRPLVCAFLSTIQLEKFAASDYHRLALQKLEACPDAMESLGAPPLKVYNIHLTDRKNRIDQSTAQVLCVLGRHQNVLSCVLCQ